MPMHDDDPFEGGIKVPSLSWRDLPVGSTFVLDVLEPAKLLQSRDFDTSEPAFWDPPTNSQPKMSAVVNTRVRSGPHSVGEDRSVWAAKPSSLFVAIANAQREAGQKIQPGGVLRLRFSGEKPHENKRFNAIKQYEAKYEPPAGSDAFAEPPAREQAQAAPKTASPW